MTEEEKQLIQMITYMLQELCMTERVQALVDARGYDLLKLLYYNKKLHMIACDECKVLEEKGQEYRKASRGDDPEDWFTEYAREWVEKQEYYSKKEELPEWQRKLFRDIDTLDLL